MTLNRKGSRRNNILHHCAPPHKEKNPARPRAPPAPPLSKRSAPGRQETQQHRKRETSPQVLSVLLTETFYHVVPTKKVLELIVLHLVIAQRCLTQF
jgi:hypothetical protein